jgi:hypothetical protein
MEPSWVATLKEAVRVRGTRVDTETTRPRANQNSSRQIDAAVLRCLDEAEAPLSRSALRAALRCRTDHLDEALARLTEFGIVVPQGARVSHFDAPRAEGGRLKRRRAESDIRENVARDFARRSSSHDRRPPGAPRSKLIKPPPALSKFSRDHTGTIAREYRGPVMAATRIEPAIIAVGRTSLLGSQGVTDPRSVPDRFDRDPLILPEVVVHHPSETVETMLGPMLDAPVASGRAGRAVNTTEKREFIGAAYGLSHRFPDGRSRSTSKST